MYSGAFGVRQAERLLWRAGFGPSPGHAQALAAMGLHRAVAALTRPEGSATLTGAEPTDGDGNPLAPEDAYGHDHLWWLDRMVRTNQPLVERMTLVWHDWFSTSNDGVGQQSLMLAQNELFRRNAFGSFDQLAHDVTQEPAMIVWLNLNENSRWSPNENYARELMELFTLGADRGAYTEQDVRNLARALTGFDFEWSDELGMYDFRYVPARHDNGSKTVFGQTGAFTWEQGVAMCVHHPMHPSFFVNKLWSYFVATPPSDSDRQALESLYASGGYQVRPVLEAILLHPDFHTGPRMVKPPVVLRGRPPADAPAEHRRRVLGLVLPTARGSGSSTRRTCRGGTTRAGSTRAPCAGASTSSRRRSPTGISTATRSTTTTRPRRPRPPWPPHGSGRATRT